MVDRKLIIDDFQVEGAVVSNPIQLAFHVYGSDTDLLVGLDAMKSLSAESIQLVLNRTFI